MNPRHVRRMTLIAGAISLLVAGAVIAQGASEDAAVWVSGPVEPVFIDKTLQDLPPRQPWLPGDPTREVNPRQVTNPDALTRPVPVCEAQPDPLLPLQAAALMSVDRTFTSLQVNVEGQGFTGVWPPDTVGAVGTTHYVQMINSPDGSSVQVYDKTTGATVLAAYALDSLAPAGDVCSTGGAGDPIPLFDQLADRWLLTEFVDHSVGNHLCVYVSSGADPTTSTWMLYRFDTPSFPDYPKYAVWPDAYYVGANETDASGLAVYALDRDQMLAGAPASLIRRTVTLLPGFSFQILAPVDLDGAVPPPAGSPGIFIRHRDDEAHDVSPIPGSDKLELYELSADFTTPANSVLTGPIEIAVAEFESELCGLTSFFCFPQPGTTQLLDPLREPVMHRPVYRNFGTHQALVGNFVTDVDGGAADRGGIRWFELRRAAGATTGGWSLFQEGTVSAADGLSRWMGSIAMDQQGNMALGYSTSGPAAGQFPSIRYSGRQSGDPAGTMPEGETEIVAGGDFQIDSVRWGDYSAMTVDPTDDCTFWYTNEYIRADNLHFWSTRIASFSFSSCASCPGATLGCNQLVSASLADPAATQLIDSYSCNSFEYAGKEMVYEFTSPVAGDLTLELFGTATDLDLFVLSSDGGCDGENCIAVSENSGTDETLTFAATFGTTYLVSVDDFDGSGGSFTISVNCPGVIFTDGFESGDVSVWSDLFP